MHVCIYICTCVEQIELQAKLLNYFLGSNKSNINQICIYMCIYTSPYAFLQRLCMHSQVLLSTMHVQVCTLDRCCEYQLTHLFHARYKMCICAMYTHVYMHMYLYIYMCMHVYIYICMYVYTYICIYIWMCICVYVYMCMYVCIYIFMYVYVCVYVYVYVSISHVCAVCFI